MFLRALLATTTLIALGAIAVSQWIVRPHIRQLATARDRNLQDYQTEQRLHAQTRAALEGTRAKLAESERNLDDAKKQLISANTKAGEQEERMSSLASDLAKARQDLAETRADLAAWAALGIPLPQLKSLVAELNKLRATNEVLHEELAVLTTAWQQVIANRGTNTDADPVLPVGLQGTVVAVDPKFDFVVLDIGASNGVEPRGVLLVSRQSRLVGKVRVASVQSERSIANIVPGWKLGEIKEGDQVLY